MIWMLQIVLFFSFVIKMSCEARDNISCMEEDCTREWSTKLLGTKDTKEGCRDNDNLCDEITFINSSCEISSVVFEMEDRSVCRVDKNSHLWSRECIIEIVKAKAASPYICEGEIKLERISLVSGYNTPSIAESTGPSKSNLHRYYSSIDIT